MRIKTVTLGAGVASILRGGREVGTVERSQGGPTLAEGLWFAYPSPSAADMMSAQHDRAAHAVAWGRTRREAVDAFALAF